MKQKRPALSSDRDESSRYHPNWKCRYTHSPLLPVNVGQRLALPHGCGFGSRCSRT